VGTGGCYRGGKAAGAYR